MGGTFIKHFEQDGRATGQPGVLARDPLLGSRMCVRRLHKDTQLATASVHPGAETLLTNTSQMLT